MKVLFGSLQLSLHPLWSRVSKEEWVKNHFMSSGMFQLDGSWTMDSVKGYVVTRVELVDEGKARIFAIATAANREAALLRAVKQNHNAEQDTIAGIYNVIQRNAESGLTLYHACSPGMMRC